MMLLNGYSWLPGLGRTPAPTRLLGVRATALRGPDAVRFFYDERHVRRHGALPEPVRGTLTGKGAVHTLDGEDHHRRKAMFLALLKEPAHIKRLADEVDAAWDAASARWPGRKVILFEESGRILTDAVCRWAGVQLPPGTLPRVAADLQAMVDGFATGGPRHWRARRARGRQERQFQALVSGVRDGSAVVPQGSACDVVARQPSLSPRTAAVELLNIIRPTVAVSWFVAFTAHALWRWPGQRQALRDGGAEYARAFAHEVRRFYPFAPFVGGRAVDTLTYGGVEIPKGSMVLLDIYGQNHDNLLWPDPYRFAPQRFLEREPGQDDLIPQGGGDPALHRCPGEDITVTLMAQIAARLAALDYEVPPQDLEISLRRIPALPRSRVVIRVR
ncbi:cytochrome P450 [Catenuloplanes atrovinosus]|uniref:Fatty-acid peroxygenase n=1 Tax=Catenuloplanes atrovinosus TaxID=137266 RepID=A0AAE3YM35_9ACTN|nr:cytochrome P450 [Catenuloplanes atrovinosus]MDR7275527.1 fatty-acid peroxygenase [Catenuloplanes atrovinosus]